MFLIQIRKPWGHYQEVAWTDNLTTAHEIGRKEVLKLAMDNDLSHTQIGYLIVYLAPNGKVEYIPALDKPWQWCDRIIKNGVQNEFNGIRKKQKCHQAGNYEGNREWAGEIPQENAWWSLGD